MKYAKIDLSLQTVDEGNAISPQQQPGLRSFVSGLRIIFTP